MPKSGPYPGARPGTIGKRRSKAEIVALPEKNVGLKNGRFTVSYLFDLHRNVGIKKGKSNQKGPGIIDDRQN